MWPVWFPARGDSGTDDHIWHARERHQSGVVSLASMNLREMSNDGDQFAHSRHSEAEHGVATFIAVKGDTLDDPLHVFNREPICAGRILLR